MTLTLLNNRYKISRGLAGGGFGHTFLAEDTYLPSRRHCVIKQLQPVSNSPQTFQLVQNRFQREAAILEKLGESNRQIPKLYAYFEEAGQFYLIQEFIEGQTLTEMVRSSGVLSDNSVQNILVDLLPVLDYIHSQGIIHRDVKPDNIILRQSDRQPVLIDFGAVKEVMTTTTNGHSIVIGTPGFMPMEQAAGHPTYASDLYGLGLTAIYLLTGRLPPELGIDRESGELIWHQYAPSVSPKLGAVLDKVVRWHPSERYSSARQMLNDLQSTPKPAYAATPSQANTVAVAPGAAYTRPAQVTPAEGFGGWKRSAAIAASLICGALVIGIVFAKTRQPQPTSQPTPESSIATRRTEISPESESPSVQPPTVSTSQPTPDRSVVTRRNPSTPAISPAFEAPSPSLSPDAAIPPPTSTSTPEARIPTRRIIPTFPVGTPRSVVESTLGSPTKISKGAFGKTRAASYKDYIPGEVNLGYLFDRETERIRQTEAAIAQSVDLDQIQTTLDQMIDGRTTEEIRQKLQRVYQRQSNYASFAVGDLKGEIQRDKSDRIYIGVWDENLH